MDVKSKESTTAPLTMENANNDPPPFYYEKEIDPKRLKEFDAYEILIKHCGIPEQDVLKHVTEQRDKAWNVFPYPCIGKWQFLDCGINKSAVYPEVLERIKSGQKYLEAGCAFGQDIRKLVTDGAPPANLIAEDLSDDLWSVGFDLFNDASKLDVRFIAADVQAASSPLTMPPPEGVAGTVDMIHASWFFHLFTRTEQVNAARNLIQALRPGPGTLIMGRQIGNKHPGEYGKKIPHKDGREGTTAYRHTEETWKQLWQEVGESTGSKWEVEHYEESEIEHKWVPFEPEGLIKQLWVARRVA
ncbi:hypothetical protein IWZ01DRAFT_539329 [Phyllosticta capitalensis]